jgi:hypothetical protein
MRHWKETSNVQRPTSNIQLGRLQLHSWTPNAGRVSRTIRWSWAAATEGVLRRFLCFRLVLERCLNLLDYALECSFVGNREIGKNFAIESDVRGLQTLGETAVGETLRANGCVQALDPEITERALARLRSR